MERPSIHVSMTVTRLSD
jgi:hypothetical protein